MAREGKRGSDRNFRRKLVRWKVVGNSKVTISNEYAHSLPFTFFTLSTFSEQGAMMNIQGMEAREEQAVNVAPSTKAREAYFLDFARAMQEVVKVPLMVTGGFRTKAAMEYALESGGADVIGIGRPLCVMTDGAKQILDGKIDELPKYENDRDLLPEYLNFLKRFQMIKLVNSFAAIFWYYEQLESLGQTGKAVPEVGTFQALLATEKRSNKILAARTKGKTVQTNASSNSTATMAAVGVAAAVGAAFVMRSYKN